MASVLNYMNFHEDFETKYAPSLQRARFPCEPPKDLRKSNFFNFEVCLQDTSGSQVSILEAKFVRFLDDNIEKNGIEYNLLLRYANGSQNQESLYIRLVDSKSYELIRYEGQDGNPNMKRVLLTHESVCSRCNQNRSCGNKNETPSDPTIIDKHILKFFLKCNQNCLKGAGNPRDNRRFRIAVSATPIRIGQQNVLAYSDEIFVHNNSKHSKKRKSSSFDIKGIEQFPKIDIVVPEKGHTLSKIFVTGENFIRGLKIYIDEYPVETEFYSPSLLQGVIPVLPPRPQPMTITVRLEDEIFCHNTKTFHIECPEIKSCFPERGIAGQCFIIIGNGLAFEGIAVWFEDYQLPTQILSDHALKALIPYDVPSGPLQMRLQCGTTILLHFTYVVMYAGQAYVAYYEGFQMQNANAHQVLTSSPASSTTNHSQLPTTPYHNASYNRYHSFYSSSTDSSDGRSPSTSSISLCG